MEETNQGTNRQADTSKEGDVTSLVLFEKNPHFAYIHRKTEKLVTAVYMITNFIKDNEPLKWKIRENALSLMALNISFNTVPLSERKDLIKEYQALSVEIVSLTGIAHHAGLISEMNYKILSREFTNLLSTIERDETKKATEESVVLDPGFFETSLPVPEPRAPRTLDAMPREKADAPRVLYSAPASSDKGQAASIPSKPEYLSLKDTVARSTPAPQPIKDKQPKAADSKDGRQTIIIKLLTKKSGLNVNDFVESIKGVSVKTIQRELLAMVASGVLKKEGERRWSTYSLNKQP